MPSTRSTTELIVTSNSALDTVSVRIARPTADSYRQLGVFFALLKVDNIPSLIPWADQLLQYAEQTYTQSIKLDPAASVDRALGQVRQKLKLKLQQIVQETRSITLNDVHYCFGALKGKNLTLTHQGGVRAMVLHQRAIGNNDVHAHWINLTDIPLVKPAARKTSDHQAGPSVVSGAIGPKDTIIVATESLFDTLSLGKIEQLINDPAMDGAEKMLDRNLQSAVSRFNIGVLLLRATDASAFRTPVERVTDSMAHLENQEADTRSLLVSTGPSPLKSATNFIRAAWSRPKTIIDQPAKPLAEEVGREIGKIFRKTTAALGQLSLWLMITPVRLLVKLTSPDGRRGFAGDWRRSLQTAAETVARKIQSWPRSTQKLLVLSLFLAYLFTQSLVFLAHKNSQDAESAQVIAAAEQIQSKLDQAESNLIYGNSEAASLLIAAAKADLEALPNDTVTEKQRWQLLNDKIAALQHQAAREVVINNPSIVADFASSELGQVDGLILNGDNLLAYRHDGVRLATMNLKTNEVKQVATTQAYPLQAGTSLSPAATAFLSNGMIVKVDNDGATNKLTPNNTLPTISALAAYNNRLYILSATDKQVWRYQVADSNLNNGSPWIKGSSNELLNSSALAVDGQIYVLNSQGRIYKFANGEIVNWNSGSVITESASRLQTGDYDYLVALDKGQKKIMIWQKSDGKLLQQYILNSLEELKDTVVSSDGKSIYLTDGKKIYKINLTVSE